MKTACGTKVQPEPDVAGTNNWVTKHTINRMKDDRKYINAGEGAWLIAMLANTYIQCGKLINVYHVLHRLFITMYCKCIAVVLWDQIRHNEPFGTCGFYCCDQGFSIATLSYHGSEDC